MIRPSTAVRAAALGLAAGSRSSLGPCAPVWAQAQIQGRTGLRRWAALAVLAELAVDKVPSVPARTDGPGPALRALSGAVGGALLARGVGEPVLPAAVIAGALAPVGATAGVRWRARWAEQGPPWAGAVLEDAAALTLAHLALAGRWVSSSRS